MDGWTPQQLNFYDYYLRLRTLDDEDDLLRPASSLIPLMLSNWSLDDLERRPLNGKFDVESRTDSIVDPFMAEIGGGGGVGLFIKLLLGLIGSLALANVSLTVLDSEVEVGQLSTDTGGRDDVSVVEELFVVDDDGKNAESSSSCSPPSVDMVYGFL